jgi:hypothetical protein
MVGPPLPVAHLARPHGDDLGVGRVFGVVPERLPPAPWVGPGRSGHLCVYGAFEVEAGGCWTFIPIAVLTRAKV